ncbi:MAG: N-acetyltransferase family protein [Verrucomicrobiales bacterium]|jgi:GNAT superfamily N-acetyltransferase|tara:strand:- start:912 stop:1733 length:822 start_codon:yes stop_codon:yes gene_type:complete
MKSADQTLDGKLGLWWKKTPAYQDYSVGCLGIPSSLAQLNEAEAILRDQGCTIAIGPMEGNTWRSHRAIIESDGSPPFLLEPISPPETTDLFKSSGYQILAQYSSSLINLEGESPDLTRLQNRLSQIKIRPLDLSNLESQLRAIYQLSTRTFVDNFLYTSISESEFLGQYLAFKSYLTSNGAFLAEQDGELIGFVFGYPDHKRFIVKTLAVLAERRFAGLGTLLVDRIQSQARQSGFTNAIHALQREDNQSLRISTRFNARIFRRYALFAKPL